MALSIEAIDLAKVPGKPTPRLERYAAILRECALVAADEDA